MATTVAVGLQLIKDEALQICVHVADARHPHVRHESRRYLVLHGAYAPDEFELLHGESPVEVIISEWQLLEQGSLRIVPMVLLKDLLLSADWADMHENALT